MIVKYNNVNKQQKRTQFLICNIAGTLTIFLLPLSLLSYSGNKKIAEIKK